MMKTIFVDAVHCFIVPDGRGGFCVDEEMRRMLDSFPNKKILLTNANDEEIKTFGLDRAPYEVFTLKHNPEKKEPEYYEIALTRFGLFANDTLYVEHDETAVKSAESVGIRTFHYDSKTKNIALMKDFLSE